LSPLGSSLPAFPSPKFIPDQEAPLKIPDTLSELEKSLLKPLVYDLPNPPTQSGEAKTVHPFAGGESNAMDRLKSLIKTGAMSSYADTRNGLLGIEFSTKLSAFLALGCISARQIHDELLKMENGEDATYDKAAGYGKGENAGTKAVRLELLWRDYMRLCTKKFGTKLFRQGGFRQDDGYEKKWKTADKKSAESGQQPSPEAVGKILSRVLEGSTGMGLIDASQRELYLTGYTSNRARQNVASFLTKHLGIDWRYGAEWYESLLLDYDVSSNWANWQYVAGVGNDPRGDARIFNPVKQAFDYDKDGEYVRTWVPEVKGLENVENVFQAWTTSAEELEKNDLANNIMVTDPLKRIDFTVDRKPKNNRRPYLRGRGGGGNCGGGSNGGRGNRRGSLGMGYGRGAPPPIQLMPMPDNMAATQLAASPTMYGPSMGYDAAYAWGPTMPMPLQPTPMQWSGPPPMATSGWVTGGPVYGEYMPSHIGVPGYLPRFANEGGYLQDGVQDDNQNRGRKYV
jgi:deoxyribodipyrimidine photo-lyase